MRKLITLLALSTLLSGCAGYHVGSTLPKEIKTVFVPTVINASSEPLIETALTPALQSEMITRTSLKLSNRDRADAILEVRVTNYRLSAIGYVTSDDDNSSSAREYRVWMTADAALRNRNTGEIIAESTGIRGKATFMIENEDAQGDLAGAKRSSLPYVCSDLAREIADAVTEIWE
jgi:hypothetical protein